MPIRFRRPVLLRMGRPLSRRFRRGLAVILVLLLLLAFCLRSYSYFRELSASMAVSNAKDMITQTVNGIVLQVMSDPQLSYENFVTLERDNEGRVSAIITNMAQVNALSAELLNAVATAADRGGLDLKIPLGDLLGISFLLSRGPRVPVKITMLTSSRADFRNDLVSAGINQTKHRVALELRVDVDVLLPWEILSTQIVSDILVAETLVVGSVPETYMSWDR